MFANAHRANNHRPFTIEDFMPGETIETSSDEMTQAEKIRNFRDVLHQALGRAELPEWARKRPQ